MLAISKEFRFCASHRLDGLPDGHKCGRLHGHNYVVTIAIEAGVLDSAGMIVDYAELAPFGDWIRDNLDHRHLGYGACFDSQEEVTDPPAVDFNPTAELLAEHLLAKARELLGPQVLQGAVVTSVSVAETDGTDAMAFA